MNNPNPDVIVSKLKEFYPDATCSLDFSTPFEILVAVMLSAQCTDNRVNIVTKTLFSKCPTIHSYIDIASKDLEEIIKPCGFFNVKAKNIKLCAQIISDKYNSNVPNDPNLLEELPGIR